VYHVTTAIPQLLVWLDQRTNGPPAPVTSPYYSAVLGDASNYISGGESGLNKFIPMSMVYPLYIDAFPRRDPHLTLNLYDHNLLGIAHLLTNTLTFANPLHQTYPQWQPEPLPATKRTGDLEVTVQKFETGHNSNLNYHDHEYGTNLADGRNCTAVSLKFRPLTNTNESWQVCRAELTDATGNHVHNFGMSWNPNDASFAFYPSLWPGEAAWKIKLELKRTEGFRPGETFVFKNVPLGELDHTNTIGWTTNIAGVSATLASICRRTPLNGLVWPSSQNSTVHFSITAVPAGSELDMLQMVYDTGQTNHCDWWSSSGNERDYTFREIPLDAKNADITFAIQQTRTVEFTLKPELPKAKPIAKINK
jgi:hypothetical protein